MNFEEAVIQGVVAQFFTSHATSASPDGTVYYQPAPALNVALKLFDVKKEQILEAVIAKLDIEDLAAKIAAAVIKDLTERPDPYAYRRDTSAKAFQQDLRKAVIEKLATSEADRLMAASGMTSLPTEEG